jgi:O-antigen ligase
MSRFLFAFCHLSRITRSLLTTSRMNPEGITIPSVTNSPTRWFLFGLAVVMLALWFPFIPNWQTFIHMWRVELFASLFLAATLIFILIRSDRFRDLITLHADEWRFVVLPLLSFAAWSAVSAIWAPSWKSAIHHTFLWCEYLTFYLLFRQMLERDGMQTRIALVFVLVLTLHAIPAILEYCAYLVLGGATSIGTRFAKYGEQVVTLIPLALIWVARTRGRTFLIGAAVLCSLWLLVFCGLGRTNYLLFAAVVVAIFTGFLLSPRHRRHTSRFALISLLFLLVPIPLLVFSAFSETGTNPALHRLSDNETFTTSGNFRKLMLSLGVEMIRENPVSGIGADNFGMEVNKYRQSYGERNPNDPNLAAAEGEIPNHAHNEYLQITAELGIVGMAIFGWFLAGILLLFFRSVTQLRKGSLYPFAAVIGLAAFLLSSLVSSYSFRLMQNGIIFFFVLAVATRALFRPDAGVEHRPIPVLLTKAVCTAALLITMGLTVYWTFRLASVVVVARANDTRRLDEARPLYDLAIRLDDENADAKQNLGMRLFYRKRYAEAVPHLEAAIALGRAPSAEISYLATARMFSGDDSGAEATMRMACELYPRSTFVLTRYAMLLEKNGKHDTAAATFDRAMAINEKQARTWRTAIESGPKAVSEAAARDGNVFHLMQLTPLNSVYAVVIERYLKFPEEQKYSALKLASDEEELP